jgi:hypothetical protein
MFFSTLPVLLLTVSTRLIESLSKTLVIVILFVTIIYSLGWLHRLLIWFLEREASKALNHIPVSIGGLEFDLLRGKLWITNFMFHSPKRDIWKWESPAVARIGALYVEANIISWLFAFWILWEKDPPVDLITVKLSDVQVFIERKQQVFNFYLLDPLISIAHTGTYGDNETLTYDGAEHETDQTTGRATGPLEQTSHDATATDDDHEKAQQLVDSMCRAIGRVAQQGSLQDAFTESRLSITSHLKAFQQTTAAKSKSEAMQEGVKIVQQVGKSLVETTQGVQQVVLPARREHVKNEFTMRVRIGCLKFEQLRIFTRQHKSWNKPIYLPKVILRAAELCPSSNEYAVYQPVDKILECVRVKLLTEVAKTNSGRLFQTAMGEMLEYWKEQDGAHRSSTE